MVNGTAAEVTRPEKVLWPEIGVTKQRYVAYLATVGDRMLPWLHDRPLTLVRAPDGIEGKRYFQKAVSTYAPAWVRTVRVPAPSARRDIDYVLCNDDATLGWLGNQAAVELHPAPVRADRLDRPDLLVVDIDPPADAFDAGVEAAGLVLEVLADLRLSFGVKTTGGKGVHVVVPIERRVPPPALRVAARWLTDLVTARRPDLVTDEFRKADRGDRVLIDPSRNGTGSTIVAPYSPRAYPGATVSFPVPAERLGEVRPGDFTLANAATLLDTDGPRRWHDLAHERSRLPRTLWDR